MWSQGVAGVAAWLALGCGGIARSESNREDVPSSGGRSTQSASGGATAGTGGEREAGSFAPCVTRDHAMINLDGSDGTVESGPDTQREVVFDAVALPVADGDMDMNTCPDQDCNGRQTITRNVTIHAPGLKWQVASDSLIHFHYSESCTAAGCARAVLIKSLDAVGPEKNRHPAASGLYLAVSDGFLRQSDAPYSLSTTPVTCANAHAPGAEADCGASNPATLYALNFADPNGGTPTVVAMGEQGDLTLNGHVVRARNLRSYAGAGCAAPTNYAYWVNGTDTP